MTSNFAFARAAFGIVASLFLAGSFVAAATGPGYAAPIAAVQTV